jgi:hypothetical protein
MKCVMHYSAFGYIVISLLEWAIDEHTKLKLKRGIN